MDPFSRIYETEEHSDAFSIMLDSYEIFELIGKGGEGRVYRAYHKRLKKQVVIKVLHSNKRRGRREADILKALKSSYLPQVYDVLETEGFVFTVMEFIPGESLGSLLKCGRVFHIRQVYQWALELSEVLSYIHSQSPPVIHGDIKPDNIMLKKDGSISLIDFNVSAVSKSGTVRALGGTIGYAAPEQAVRGKAENIGVSKRGEEKTELLENSPKTVGTVDNRADIYSFGAVFYHLLTGVRPQASAKDNIPVTMERAGGYYGLASMIEKAMALDRNKRFQTADELKEALLDIGRMDSHYQVLDRRRGRIIFILRSVFLLSGFFSVIGYGLLKNERFIAYRNTVAQMEGARLKGDYSEMQIFYEKAVRMEPERDNAGIQMALSYYERGEYAEGISYIKTNLLFRSFRKEEAKDRTFSILANCYFYLGDYETAAGYFKKAMEQNPQNEEYYRDCIIPLIRMGELKEAEEILNKVEVSDISLSFIQGEIYFYQKDYNNALEKFLSCIEGSDKEEIRIRAWSMAAESYKSMSQPDKEIGTLISAKMEVFYVYQPKIIEQLAKAYIRRGNVRNSVSDIEMAVEEFRELKRRGWNSYENGITLSLLYQRLGKYSEAFQELEEMQILYGENYQIYMRLAFLEADKQSEIEHERRSYESFRFYCDEALKRYQEEPGHRGPDLDMEVLEEFYLGIQQGGWFFE